MDEKTIAALLSDLDRAPIAKAENLLRFTRKVTFDAASIAAQDMKPLRQTGWDGAAIYYAITVTALLKFYNRLVSSSGAHAVSHQGHRINGSTIAERGYVRA